MVADPDKEPTEPVEIDAPSEALPQAVSLVPLAGAPAIVPGIQAFRRGDVILYTVRGEPREVQELMGHLSDENVGEVIALISHQAGDEGENAADDAGPADAGEAERG